MNSTAQILASLATLLGVVWSIWQSVRNGRALETQAKALKQVDSKQDEQHRAVNLRLDQAIAAAEKLGYQAGMAAGVQQEREEARGRIGNPPGGETLRS